MKSKETVGAAIFRETPSWVTLIQLFTLVKLSFGDHFGGRSRGRKTIYSTLLACTANLNSPLCKTRVAYDCLFQIAARNACQICDAGRRCRTLNASNHIRVRLWLFCQDVLPSSSLKKSHMSHISHFNQSHSFTLNRRKFKISSLAGMPGMQFQQLQHAKRHGFLLRYISVHILYIERDNFPVQKIMLVIDLHPYTAKQINDCVKLNGANIKRLRMVF